MVLSSFRLRIIDPMLPRMKYLIGCYWLIMATWVQAQTKPDYQVQGEAWWAHVQTLADDKMEGRNTGSEGYQRAAAYVAGEFERLGLKPAGTRGYFQPVKFRVRQIIETESSLELVKEGTRDRLSFANDANFILPADMAKHIKAPAVFVGHGLVIPELGVDDLAGLNLKGKIAVLISGGPKRIPGPLKAHFSHTKQQWQALRQAGAIGMAVIRNPKSADIPWERSTLARLQPAMSLADSKLDDAAGMEIAIRINPAKADKFFSGTDHTIAELLKLADEDRPLPKFPLAVSIQATASLKKTHVESMNLAAILEGSDANLRNEYVVLSAHLDHLGVGEAINGDRLYNGAMDNASGVASILEMARLLKSSSLAPKRSVLLLAVTGEEKGLQGSKYFAHYPTVPRQALVADINLDMFMPLHSLQRLRVFGLGESTLGDDIRTVCAGEGIVVEPDPEPDRNIFIRSDQYSFIRLGIPSLSFKFGYEPGSPEERLHKDWLKLRYHAPSDDLSQPVDKAAAAQFNHLLLLFTRQIAESPERPRWNSDSFFRRFAK